MPLRLRLSYESSQYVRSLDGFRGYCMVGVFLYHCFVYPPLKHYVHWTWWGVDFFFVISGFLITGILLDTRESPRYFRDFYVRRVLRIFPLYYMVLAAVTVMALTLDHSVWKLPVAEVLPWFWVYLANYKIAFSDWSGLVPIGHFWSLAVEEQFYLVWPFLVLKLRQRRILQLCLVASLASFVLRQIRPDFPFAYTFTFCRLEGLMIGAAIAVLIRTDRARLERWVPPTLLVSGLGLFVLVRARNGFMVGDEGTIRWGYTLMPLFFGSLLVGALDQGPLGRVTRFFTDRDALIFIGRYSYGIYVYHWILHSLLKRPLLDRLSGGGELSWQVSLSYLAIVSALTLGVTLASFHLLEKRFLRLKRVLAPRAGGDPGAPERSRKTLPDG